MGNPWFRVFDPPSGKPSMRLCVFHHAGGSSGAFFKWKKELPESWGLVLVELPGRGARYREPLSQNFSQLISELALAFHQTIEGPVVLAGHSMGALLAFELYRKLGSDRKKDVRGLLLSSFLAPTSENLENRAKFSHLRDDEFLSEIRKYCQIPPEVLTNPQAKTYFIGLLRGDFLLLENYTNTNLTRAEVPMLVCGAANDPIVDATRLNDWNQFGQMMGAVRIFPGDHFYITQHFRELIAAIASTFS